MIQINLLPWREELRKIQKTQFIIIIVGCCLISFILFLVLHFHYKSIDMNQKALNSMLSAAINAEQNILNQMGSKANDAIATETQLNFIINLYKENNFAVRILNELVSLVPSTVSVNEIKRNNNQIILSGMATSEDEVSRLINDIGKSPYFEQPELLSMNAVKNADNDSRNFSIMFDQKG